MDDDARTYLAKAAESLQSAESEFDSGRYNSCANRCYYACFQAAIAALTQDGIQPRGNWGHDSVQAQFVGQLINRRKQFSADLRQVLAETRTVRIQADYKATYVTRTQASRALSRARTFVTAVQMRRSRAS